MNCLFTSRRFKDDLHTENKGLNAKRNLPNQVFAVLRRTKTTVVCDFPHGDATAGEQKPVPCHVTSVVVCHDAPRPALLKVVGEHDSA